MAKTNSQIGFKTRYRIQVIDSDTLLPVTEPIVVDNMVLHSGILALGKDTAYSNISIGTSGLPVSYEQTDLISKVSELPISTGTFAQTIFETQTSDVVSRITQEFLFKEYRFPANSRVITLREVGISGVTRAILPTPIEVNKKQWVNVVVEIDYIYRGRQNNLADLRINGDATSEVLKYNVTPFIYNTTPQNSSGKGFGTNGAVLGYVWDGLESGISVRDYSDSIGLIVNRELRYSESKILFTISGTVNNDTIISGFIIRDTVNGGAFKITFPDVLQIQEDDGINLVIAYSWGQEQNNGQ